MYKRRTPKRLWLSRRRRGSEGVRELHSGNRKQDPRLLARGRGPPSRLPPLLQPGSDCVIGRLPPGPRMLKPSSVTPAAPGMEGSLVALTYQGMTFYSRRVL